ncbi:hypothetical protein FHS85_001735 [Rhodoligotrophos appendicifer]|uniref:hypothetical protein n=1 Tax=Rhodoligotrophos appendicifer TaxID=987056 RepID=UPI0011864081|nr:hypothetical protein [Rhodoligotrophos appendicifer]
MSTAIDLAVIWVKEYEEAKCVLDPYLGHARDGPGLRSYNWRGDRDRTFSCLAGLSCWQEQDRVLGDLKLVAASDRAGAQV